MTALAPTAQQAAFLAALRTSTGHMALLARAGCGKTSTILMAVVDIAAREPRAEMLIAAYNASINKEIEAKIKAAGYDWRQAQSSTVHSLGFGLVKFALRLTRESINEHKVRDIVAAQNEEVYEQYGRQVSQLVAYAKQAGFGFFPDKAVGNRAAWYALADHFDVNGFEDTMDMDEVVDAAMNVYRLSLADTATIDFDDMILFPLVKNLRTKFTKDYIFLDEAQDTSAARQALVRKFLRPRTGRLVIVGDDRQAIYGFTGADASAMPNLIANMGATVLPLSVTWRCPRAVVELARTLVPDIEAAPEAPEGEVRTVQVLKAGGGVDKERFAAFVPTLTAQDAILCRKTAPLVDAAYKLIRAGVPCKVEGRAIGDGLINLARRWKVKTIDALRTRLEAYREREVQKAMAKGNEAKVQEVDDKCQTLVEVMDGVAAEGKTQVADVVAFIQALFADDVRGVLTLATYHRSKGREWGNVYLWDHGGCWPSRAARQDWQRVQEDNLAYVAYTRAMRTLTFVQ